MRISDWSSDVCSSDLGKVSAERVRDMLGLADKGAQRRLLRQLLEGDAQAMLAAVAEQYALGVEPLALMRALMDLTHRITVAQISGGEADAPGADERADLGDLAARLSAAQLPRLCHSLLTAHGEVRTAPLPLLPARMPDRHILRAGEGWCRR